MIRSCWGKRFRELKGIDSILPRWTWTLNDIHRFKVAAHKNGKRWYHATARLLPCSSSAVQIWDPVSHSFVDHPESTKVSPVVEFKGPFIYFLSTVNVDRLETEFIITPLAQEVPPASNTCDIVIVRPLRDPSIGEEGETGREQFVEKIWGVIGGAYKRGSHIDLRYDHNGHIVNDGDGPLVVEYIRCGGWEWIPVGSFWFVSSTTQDANILRMTRTREQIWFVLMERCLR